MSRGIVVDASVCSSWLLKDESTPVSEYLLDHVLRGTLHLVLPELWHYEMLNLVRSAVIRKRMTEQVAKQSLSVLRHVLAEFVGVVFQGPAGILSDALRYGLSAYDATYFALAQTRGIDLVSADQDLLALRDQCPWIRNVDEFCRRELQWTNPRD